MSKTQNTNKSVVKGAIKDLEKRFGAGIVMKLGEKDAIQDIGVISTGSLSLDVALGVGGMPRGRITEVFGAESAGKSTLAMSVTAQAQKLGGTCAYVDVEHAMDPVYAGVIGVDVDELIISQPDSAEMALEIVDKLVRTTAFDVVVLDSVAALVPSSELNGEMGNQRIGEQARLMSQALRKLTGVISKTNTVCIFINQLRSKVGVVYGSPEITSGGNALKYYASVRLDMRRRETLKEFDSPTGIKIRARVVKNKVAPPFRTAEIVTYFNSGIDILDDVIDLAIVHGMIDQRGAFYYMNDVQICRGKEKLKNYFKENVDQLDTLTAAVKEAALR